jgi:hypothetical protein
MSNLVSHIKGISRAEGVSNWAVRKICVSKWEKELGVGSRMEEIPNEERHDVYSSTNIVRVIKSRRMRWAGNMACMARRKMPTGLWWEHSI